jgi:hypothetical protein
VHCGAAVQKSVQNPILQVAAESSGKIVANIAIRKKNLPGDVEKELGTFAER